MRACDTRSQRCAVASTLPLEAPALAHTATHQHAPAMLQSLETRQTDSQTPILQYAPTLASVHALPLGISRATGA